MSVLISGSQSGLFAVTGGPRRPGLPLDIVVIGAASNTLAPTDSTPVDDWNNNLQFRMAEWAVLLNIVESVTLYDPEYPRDSDEAIFPMRARPFSLWKGDQNGLFSDDFNPDHYTVVVSFTGANEMRTMSDMKWPANVFWIEAGCFCDKRDDLLTAVQYVLRSKQGFPRTYKECYEFRRDMKQDKLSPIVQHLIGAILPDLFKVLYAKPAEWHALREAFMQAKTDGAFDVSKCKLTAADVAHINKFILGQTEWNSTAAGVPYATREAAHILITGFEPF
jgi:hypothetical protein